MREWNYDTLLSAVAGVVAEAEGNDWPAVARRLGHYMDWEFEDYRP